MNQQVVDKLYRHFDTGKLKTYAKGSIITHAHHEPEGVSLIISGIVEQYEITPEGNKLAVNTFKPTAFFPMSWAINKSPNVYFFGALTKVTIKQASATETVAFLQTNPDVMFDLLSRVYMGTDTVLRRLVLAASGIASSRLIYELLIEAYRFGTEADGGDRLITVRQSVLATRTGLARETISRELHKLEQEGLFYRTEKGIVLNTNRLEHKLNIHF